MKKKFIILMVLFSLSFVLFGCKEDKTTTDTIEETTEETTEEMTTTEDKGDEKGYYTVKEIKNSPIGKAYFTEGVVIAIGEEGFLIYDESDFIYINLGKKPSVAVNDLIQVIGTSSLYKNEIQLENIVLILKITAVEGYEFEVIKLNSKNINEYMTNYNVGDYIKLSGTLTFEDDLIKLNIHNSSISGILNIIEVDDDLFDKNVTIEGFMINVIDDSLNIIVSSITKTQGTLDSLPLTILTINDLHGYIEQDEYGKNGISNMAYLVNEIRDENDYDDVILIGNGDLFQGAFLSNRSYGEVIIDCMNAMEFDAIGIGNHEFDWGIEKILQYFDGIEENGEANFPLLNANIYSVDDDSLLTVDNGNVLESYVVEREGVEVGIISYIGNVYKSIAYDKVREYYFDLNIAYSVEKVASNLKKEGVDFIIVNIHGGSSNVYNYEYNQELADLKDKNGNYLVDVVINGHTHSKTMGQISRSGATSMPVIQAGEYGNYLGRITLDLDLIDMKVTSFEMEHLSVSYAGTKHDETVQAIVDDYKERYPDEFLAVAGESIKYRNDYYNWIGNVMLATTGADIAVHNTGGVRSTGNVTEGQNVMLSQLYEISPFDNNIYLLEVTYYELKELLDREVFYSLRDGIELKPSGTYTLAVISYVYYWDQLDGVRNENYDIDTNLFIRDILVEDIKAKNELGQTFAPISNPEATIGKLFK